VTKHIAIVGACPLTRGQAPFGDPDWEVWGCSSWKWWELAGKTQAWFEIHRKDALRVDRTPEQLDAYAGFLAQHPRVYLNHPWEGVPNGLPYPQEHKAMFGGGYFDNTVSYELAHAITLRPNYIGLWGVTLAGGTEWAYQARAIFHLVDVAKAQGIKVLAPGSTLFS
jgi:hypothetical protein